MAKHPKNSKKRKNGGNRSGNPARRAGTPVVSLGAVRADRAFAVVLPAFTGWLKSNPQASEDTAFIVQILEPFFAGYAEVAPDLNVTNLNPSTVAVLLSLEEGIASGASRVLSYVLDVYTHFLRETGIWTGTESDLEQLHEVVCSFMDEADEDDYDEDDDYYDDGLEDELDAELPEIFVPTLSHTEAREQAESLPLWQHTLALLAWVGSGKGVTGTGAIQRKDIQEAAATLGIHAEGAARHRYSEPDANVETDAGEKPAVVTSMNELPRLTAYWRGLRECGLIKVGSTRAGLTSAGQALLDGDDIDPVGVTRSMSAVLFLDILRPEREWFGSALRTTVSTILLASAASTTPPPAARIFAEETEQAEDEAFTRLMDAMARREVTAWAKDGLVIVDTNITVPPVLREPLASVLDELDAWAEDHLGPAPLEARESKATHQLKVQIDGIQPPVWRRVEVPAELRLDQLHHVIQALFDWDDSHMHHFIVGGRRGTIYGPLEPDMDYWGDPPRDEATVELAGVLKKEKDKLTYEYDFGDSWQHTVTLEKILPAAEAGTLPRCTGGRCLAPMEDSGGSWGWMAKVEAANDLTDTDPDTAELREWLGLEDGETIDPTAFDPAEVDAHLQWLRPKVPGKSSPE